MTEKTYARLHQQLTDRGPWQQTASGNAFFLLQPDHHEVSINDLATSLSNQCRYNGHVLEFYSVAQHATLMSLWMEEDGYPLETCFAALHHDSAEAYTGDIIAQVKWAIPEFKQLEDRVEGAVNQALGIKWTDEVHKSVKEYDFIALATEVRDVLASNKTNYSWGDLPKPRLAKIHPIDPEGAREFFISRHRSLEQRRNA